MTKGAFEMTLLTPQATDPLSAKSTPVWTAKIGSMRRHGWPSGSISPYPLSVGSDLRH
ncbi:hypothetical protein D3C86_2114550 [compost metagenome]